MKARERGTGIERQVLRDRWTGEILVEGHQDGWST